MIHVELPQNPEQWGQFGQAAVTVVLALAAIVVGARKKVIEWQAKRAAEKGNSRPVPRVPSDALAKVHSDPEIARLERQIQRLDARFREQEAQLTAADSRDAENRRRISKLENDRSETNGTLDLVRSIVRRLVYGWPEGAEMPKFTPQEWDTVGIDEDTLPRPNLTGRPRRSER